jgi:hypothetical protein
MKLTLGTTYYENPEYLEKFVDAHLPHCDELIVVDDGSQKYKAFTVLHEDPKIKLYRVKKDYGFNSHGCRNLIMKEALHDWVVLIDVDRQFGNGGRDLSKISTKQLDETALYKFVVHVNRLGLNVHQSINDYLVNKKMFFSAGGYDEELRGVREGDRDFMFQMLHYGPQKTLDDINLMHIRPPSGTLKEELDKAKQNGVPFGLPYTQQLKDLVELRKIKPDPNKPTLTFDWERVF